MNYRHTCFETMRQLCERVGLEMTDALDVQSDLAWEYIQSRNNGPFAYDAEEMELLYRLDEFWVYVRQLWANRDRSLLASTDRLKPLCGGNLRDWYRLQHKHTLLFCYPSDSVEDAYERELHKMHQNVQQLKSLLLTH